MRPLVTLLAAAVLAIAGIVGIAHLDTGSTSSGSSGGFAAGSTPGAPMTSQPEKSADAGRTVIRHVPMDTVRQVFGRAVPRCPAGSRIAARVPSRRLRAIATALEDSAAQAAGQPQAFDIELHRASRGQTQIRLTCP
jgi:hypothetical protein